MAKLEGEGLRLLDQLDTFLARGDAQSEALWAVLSATRGPDSVNPAEKDFGTVPVRAAAFPKTAKRPNTFADLRPTGEARFAVRLDKLRGAQEHFKNHVRQAAKALGLIVKD